MTDQTTSDSKDAAKRSQDAGIADESAAYQNAAAASDDKTDTAAVPTTDTPAERESEAHPS